MFVAKLYTFDLERCIREEIRVPRDCAAIRLNAESRRDTRAFCWTYGFYKERYTYITNGIELKYMKLDKSYFQKGDCMLAEYEETDYIRKSAMLVCGLLLAQVS